MPKMTRGSGHHRYHSGVAIPTLQSPASSVPYCDPARSPIGPSYYGVGPSPAQAGLSVSYDQYTMGQLPLSPTEPSTMGGTVGAASAGEGEGVTSVPPPPPPPPPTTTTQPATQSSRRVSLPPQHRASSGAWTPEEDQTLLEARKAGLIWSQIHTMYFPNKSGNACRKRHERLKEHRGADDWDNRKLERISKEYMGMRKEIWQPLAHRCGEKWENVEKKCLSMGLKNIQSHSRAYSRRERLEAQYHGLPSSAGYEDDSGIGYMALTPVDDLDQSVPYGDPTGSSSSPETASSAGRRDGLVAGSSRHQQQQQQMASYAAAMQQQQQQQSGGYQAYGYAAPPHTTHHQRHPSGPQHAYTSSGSSSGTAAGYGQDAGAYLGRGERLSAPDMGIEALIDRGSGRGRGSRGMR